jgi:transcriptional regulator with XRE-family HTH domain
MLLWICYAFSDTYRAYKVIREGLTIPSGITKLALMEKVMLINNQSAAAIAEELGRRLKQARLNADLTQQQVSERSGVSRKVVLSAEHGKVQLESLVAILQALKLTQNLGAFLPEQAISPLQLLKLQGKQRQRASGARSRTANTSQAQGVQEDPPAW